MTAFYLSSLWLLAVLWLILRAFRQRNALPVVEPNDDANRERLLACVIVPARDEAENIESCVRSLIAQRGVDLRIVVVDDESSDDTAEIVASIARQDSRVVLRRAPPLPAGWKGKVHACCVGLQDVPDDVDWLCFIDADVRAHPLAIASAIQSATDGHLDLLSLMPRQELGSFAERLIMPCGLYALAFSQNVSKFQSPSSDDAAATGQFMLFRRKAYEDVGGHAAVFNEICEDVELARVVKREGGRVLLHDGAKLLTSRMYTGWDTLWPGFAKNINDMLGGTGRMMAVGAIAVFMAWAAVLLPAWSIGSCMDGTQGACLALAPALMGATAAFALHIAGALHFGIPVWYGLLFPFGYSAGAAIALDSIRWRLTRRIRWKGRIYQ